MQVSPDPRIHTSIVEHDISKIPKIHELLSTEISNEQINHILRVGI